MTCDSIRILIVEDHHVVRKGLVTLLGFIQGFSIVGEAGDYIEAISQFHACTPDVTLIDLRLPGKSGLEVVRNIRQGSEEARFIVLTTHDGDEDIHRALRAGVRGYLLKGTTTDELVSAIRMVHQGESYVPLSKLRVSDRTQAATTAILRGIVTLDFSRNSLQREIQIRNQ